MYTRFLNIWASFRSSFWFVPSLMMTSAAVVSFLFVEMDYHWSDEIATAFPMLQMSPPAARSILSSIVGAMVTSTGVVFSITIVALSLASSNFGSRLIRTYQNRKSTHFALGIFVSTSLYCILVLATIREVGDYQFVPIVSVIFGILLAVICLATLIYYLHDMSCAIQAPHVIESSASDLHLAIKRMYPSRIGDPPGKSSSADTPDENQLEEIASQLKDPVLTVKCDQVGYIRAIENEGVEQLAKVNHMIIRLKLRPGDFIHDGSVLAEAFYEDGFSESPDEGAHDKLARQLRDCLIVGPNRTPTQDVGYAFDELVEVAVRALSPGINDPFTAINCVDRIQAALVELKTRRTPSRFRMDEDGHLRVIANPISFQECVDRSLEVIKHYAADSPMVALRVQSALKYLSEELSA